MHANLVPFSAHLVLLFQLDYLGEPANLPLHAVDPLDDNDDLLPRAMRPRLAFHDALAKHLLEVRRDWAEKKEMVKRYLEAIYKTSIRNLTAFGAVYASNRIEISQAPSERQKGTTMT